MTPETPGSHIEGSIETPKFERIIPIGYQFSFIEGEGLLERLVVEDEATNTMAYLSSLDNWKTPHILSRPSQQKTPEQNEEARGVLMMSLSSKGGYQFFKEADIPPAFPLEQTSAFAKRLETELSKKKARVDLRSLVEEITRGK